SGKLSTIVNGAYDAAAGTVSFTTTHFSRYAVGYHPVTFVDVNDWSAPFVRFLAARELIHGVGEQRYAPNRAITRAEFVQLLANLNGAELPADARSGFSDVASNDWFSGAAGWAAKNGLIQGEAGKFNPNATLSRQDLAVILVRFSNKFAPGALNGVSNAAPFADEGEIADYAAEAVAGLRAAGFVSGKDGNRFDPAAGTTRGEVAKLLALFVQSGNL
ncbi:MAG: S-layer homology domain-containing protein, partial [Cohnella sp.]|nr:S-layer homology domain-containing protein [Cohnella sp.]